MTKSMENDRSFVHHHPCHTSCIFCHHGLYILAKHYRTIKLEANGLAEHIRVGPDLELVLWRYSTPEETARVYHLEPTLQIGRIDHIAQYVGDEMVEMAH